MSVRVLHIDCSGPFASLMLAIDSIPQAVKQSAEARDHASQLNPMIAALLLEVGYSLNDMDAFAVCSGPGSYTGLRLGMAAAKGFCYALDKPLLMHNRLTLMLEELDSQLEVSNLNRLAILPARAGEYYIAAQGEWEAAPMHILQNELVENTRFWTQPASIIGHLEEDFSIPNVKNLIPHEKLDLNTWAKRTFLSFSEQEFANIAYAIPEYLKAAYVNPLKREK
ncbi:MAG: tRNA (adenosine(37)-N6)-threonylcarbamoyltransferase complex dimerization subunit type 1 TsaB [Bacteroidetes bacterium]|nr:tRNA (adenosine(37)-N6)-threonylcarbamoyltransferase complex dimerization subunit type 1 TsaB [Bacteroidota bacterium]